MRLAGTKLAANHQYRGFGDQLYDLSGQRPSLDLNFANSKSLVDATTGQNLVTFTRASSGTYVDSQGVIRTATTNLLLRSEEFTLSPWTLFGTASRAADVTTAPNGAQTADSVTLPVAAGIYQIVSGLPNATYTFSIWIRADSSQSLRLVINTNLSDPAANTVNVSTIWQRFSVTKTTSVGTTIVSGQLDTGGGGTFYVWGAQLEQSSTVGEYIPTTSTINSAPRFDHNPTTGESLGLLVEEQRTNSIRNNTMVGAVAGTPGTLPTNWQQTGATGGITRNIVGVGVENEIPYIDLRYFGTTTNTTGLALFFESLTSAPAATNQTWTSSAYFRLMSGSIPAFIQLYVYGFSSAPGQVNQFGLTFAPTSAPLVSQRINVTGTLAAATVAFANAGIFVPAPAVGTNVDFTLRIGLPQLEQGAFPTSVIPTTTATATRSADVASITGSAFSSWVGAASHTLYSESKSIAAIMPTGATQIVWELNDNTSSNFARVFQFQPAGSLISQNMFSAGANPGRLDNGGAYSNANVKAASAFAALDRALSVNGATASVLATGSLPMALTQVQIGGAVSNFLNGHIRRLTYWPQRLSNSTLQQITQ